MSNGPKDGSPESTMMLDVSDVQDVGETTTEKTLLGSGGSKSVAADLQRLREQFLKGQLAAKPASPPAQPAKPATPKPADPEANEKTFVATGAASAELQRIREQFMKGPAPAPAPAKPADPEAGVQTAIAAPGADAEFEKVRAQIRAAQQPAPKPEAPPAPAKPEAPPAPAASRAAPEAPANVYEAPPPVVAASLPVRRAEPAREAAPARRAEPAREPAPPPPPDPWHTIAARARTSDDIAARMQRAPDELPRTPLENLAGEDPLAVFHSAAFGPGDWFVRALAARAGLSRCYEYELEIEAQFREGYETAQADRLFDAPASVGFGAEELHRVHGIVRDVELLSAAPSGTAVYRVTMVPRLWLLTQSKRSRVFQNLSVPDVVRAVLKSAGLGGDEFCRLKLTQSYAPREYVAQYEETDLDFVCRLCEHEGIFFFFEQGERGERVVFCDALGSLERGELSEPVPYARDPSLADAGGRESVTEITRRRARVPREVALQDYNWRTPGVPLAAHAEVDPAGVGVRAEYGEHYKTPEEGRRLAGVRAREISGGREVFRGRSRVRGMFPGTRFELAGHFDAALDQEYAVLDVSFSLAQRHESTVTAGGVGNAGYVNEFVAVRADASWAPPRRTPRPRIDGVAHGRIDGAQNGMAAPVDEFGRYRVVLPFAMAEKPGQNVSRWVRMAQVASGNEYGMHFPLHVGTEVLLVHVDGDPDRPVIVGSVPNAETRSPVTQNNPTASVFKTRGRIRLEFNDQ